MALYAYSGFDGNGRKVSGSIEAAGEKNALQRLRAQGIFPSSLKAQATRVALGRDIFGRLRRERVSDLELAVATRQLATLLAAGLSLDEALRLARGESVHATLGGALDRVRQAVVQGDSMASALEQQGGLFSPMFVHMVDVGEHSGHLDQALHRLADHLEAQARFRSRMLNALAYPVLMAMVGLGVLAFLFSYVLPKITDIVADLDQVLPWPTRLLLALGDAVEHYGWLGLILLALALVLAARFLRTAEGRFWRDRTLLRLPLLGPLILGQSTARFSRTLGVLLQSGVSLLQALEICRRLTANGVLQKALDQAAVSVREGESLSDPLRRSRAFPDMLVQMTAAGERSGELDAMLLRVADSYEHQTDMALSRLLALLEPLMILLMGTVVGFVVIAILLPIFQASQGLG